MVFRVESEVGQLRQVIVHRPGLELARLTPSNVHSLLFDDVLWADRAIEEHDAFTSSLRSRGVQVYYFNELLGEALQQAEAREFLLGRVVHEETPHAEPGRCRHHEQDERSCHRPSRPPVLGSFVHPHRHPLLPSGCERDAV